MCWNKQVGLVSSADQYATLVAALARDVVTLRTHRRARSQELHRLLSTKRLLDEKTKFYEDQVDLPLLKAPDMETGTRKNTKL